MIRGLSQNSDTSGVIQLIEDTGRWKLCHKGFKWFEFKLCFEI